MRIDKKQWPKLLAGITFVMNVLLVVSPPTSVNAQEVLLAQTARFEFKKTSTPKCTKKLLWYTKGSEVCAPTKTVGTYKWQKSMTKSDATKFMKTCRSFFSTSAGQMLCDWTQQYVNNIITVKGPRDNCLSYLKNLLNNAAAVAQTNKSATIGSALVPFTQRYSWICHP